jgi:Holliday junction resolvase RusA-like endonuclease
MKTATVSMPLFVMLPRKTMPDKKCMINLNQYRNWQFHQSNQVKKLYKEIAEPKLKGITFGLPVKLTFTLWKAQNRKIDRANVLCIVEKMFCDAMTECGCFPDDNDDYIVSTKYLTGGIDRADPRADILIQEVEA